MDLRNPLAIIALSPRTGLIHHQLCHAKIECPILFQPQPHSSFNFFFLQHVPYTILSGLL